MSATTFRSDHDGETMYGLTGHFAVDHDDVVLIGCTVLTLSTGGRRVELRDCFVTGNVLDNGDPIWDADDLPSTADPGIVTDPKGD